MEEKFEKMVRDFKREIIDDYSEGKITEDQFDNLYSSIDHMVYTYYNGCDTTKMIELLDCFKVDYETMK